MSQISQFIPGGSGSLMLSVTGDSGGAVSPSGAGNLNLLGGANITTVGTPASNLITINLDNTVTIDSLTVSTDATLSYMTQFTLPIIGVAGAVQDLADGLGTSGQVLTSNGVGVEPTWETVSASIDITGDSGGALSGSSFTFTGSTTGLTFAGAGTTQTLGGTLIVASGGTGATALTDHSVLVG